MKRYICLFLLVGLLHSAFAQQPEEALTKVQEGVALHDKGLYQDAISKYNEALSLDKNNMNALCELAYTYRTLKNFPESNKYAKTAIDLYLDKEEIAHAFTTLGSNYDEMKDTTNSLKAFRQGIHYFPNNVELNFNLGITLSGMDASHLPEAERCFIKCTEIDPSYASPYNALSRIQFMQEKRIPGLMVMCRFMVLEDFSSRREKSYELILRALTYGVEKTGRNSISLTINMPDTTETGKDKPNNFDNVEMILTLGSAIGGAKKSDFETLKTGITNLCSALEEGKSKGTGYFWDTYAPFFIELKKQNYVDVFSRAIYLSANDKKMEKWFKKNMDEVKEFYAWYFAYTWH